jgi:hypothetical protein
MASASEISQILNFHATLIKKNPWAIKESYLQKLSIIITNGLKSVNSINSQYDALAAVYLFVIFRQKIVPTTIKKESEKIVRDGVESLINSLPFNSDISNGPYTSSNMKDNNTNGVFSFENAKSMIIYMKLSEDSNFYDAFKRVIRTVFQLTCTDIKLHYETASGSGSDTWAYLTLTFTTENIKTDSYKFDEKNTTSQKLQQKKQSPSSSSNALNYAAIANRNPFEVLSDESPKPKSWADASPKPQSWADMSEYPDEFYKGKGKSSDDYYSDRYYDATNYNYGGYHTNVTESYGYGKESDNYDSKEHDNYHEKGKGKGKGKSKGKSKSKEDSSDCEKDSDFPLLPSKKLKTPIKTKEIENKSLIDDELIKIEESTISETLVLNEQRITKEQLFDSFMSKMDYTNDTITSNQRDLLMKLADDKYMEILKKDIEKFIKIESDINKEITDKTKYLNDIIEKRKAIESTIESSTPQ